MERPLYFALSLCLTHDRRLPYKSVLIARNHQFLHHPYNYYIPHCLEKLKSMARIYPFRALRYDTSRVKMEDVVTQPYDKITPAMQQRYYEASPYNLIRVILGKQFPTDTDDENCYTRAAETLRNWRKDHILAEESEPALYGYSQTYTVPHTYEVRERRGFIALGHLYDYADKVIYRHEQTFPKHKSDRMSLFKATRAYCEQIYMLYSDPAFTAEKLIFGNDGKEKHPGRRRRSPRPRHHRRVRRHPQGLEAHRPLADQPHRHRHGRQEAHHRRRPPPLRDLRRLRQRAQRPA